MRRASPIWWAMVGRWANRAWMSGSAGGPSTHQLPGTPVPSLYPPINPEQETEHDAARHQERRPADKRRPRARPSVCRAGPCGGWHRGADLTQCLEPPDRGRRHRPERPPLGQDRRRRARSLVRRGRHGRRHPGALPRSRAGRAGHPAEARPNDAAEGRPAPPPLPPWAGRHPARLAGHARRHPPLCPRRWDGHTAARQPTRRGDRRLQADGQVHPPRRHLGLAGCDRSCRRRADAADVRPRLRPGASAA